MKTLIYQYYKTPVTPSDVYIQTDKEYHMISAKSIKKYAEKIGADYKLLDGDLPHNLPPFFGIFQPFFEGWIHDYDKVCFIDSDILATIKSDNIFNVTPDDCLSANFMTTQHRMKKLTLGNPNFSFWKKHGHINSGVVVIPRSEYSDLVDYLKDVDTIFDKSDVVYTSLGNFDQAFVNYYVRHVNRYHMLPPKYNYHLTREDHSKRFEQDLIHYHRKNKSLMFEDINKDMILK